MSSTARTPFCGACPACGEALNDPASHCPHCAASLSSECSFCGAGVLLFHRYCAWCGFALPDRDHAAGAAAGRAGERRRAAILFADLTGSTELGHRLDAEAIYRIISRYIDALAPIVQAHGGYIVKTLGDGMMALFGAPSAHGDDACRAAAAALEMRQRALDLAETEPEPLRLRIGVNWGGIIAAPMIGSGGHRYYDVLGDAVNVAQRIESSASPGTVYAGERFYRLTSHRFTFISRGRTQVKGKPLPLPLFELLGWTEHPVRRPGALHGRGSELSICREAIEASLANDTACSRILSISGESGLGKSRLLDEFVEIAGEYGIRILTAQPSPGEQHIPFSFWRASVLASPASPDAAGGEGPGAVLQALIEAPERLAQLDAASLQAAALGAVRHFLDFYFEETPGAVVIDEAGEMDQFSLGILAQAAAAPGVAGCRSPLVITASRETLPIPGATTLPLQPLPADACRDWAREALADAEESTVDELVRRANGHPLHMELLIQAALAGEPLDEVPDSLYGALRSELDSLPAALRRAVDLAAVLGRSFPARWLLRDHEPAVLDSLLQLSFLREHQPEPDRRLEFRLGTMRDVCLDALLAGRRADLHLEAGILAREESGVHPEFAELAAEQFRQSDRPLESAESYLQAAENAAALLPGEDARTLYQAAFDQASLAGAALLAARARSGLARCLAYEGSAAASRTGFQEALAAVQEMPGAEAAGVRAGALYGLARLEGERGRTSAALETIEEALRQAVEAGPHWSSTYWRCSVEQAHLLLESGQAEEAARLAASVIQEASAPEGAMERHAALALLGLARLELGDDPGARAALEEGVRRCESASDLVGASACWINLGHLHRQAGRLPDALEALDRASHHASSTGDPSKQALISLDRSAVLLGMGRWDSACSEAENARGRFQQLEHSLGIAAAELNLAEALFRWGEPDQARELLTRALEAASSLDYPALSVAIRLLAAEIDQTAGGSVTSQIEALEEELEPASEATAVYFLLRSREMEEEQAAVLLQRALDQCPESRPIERARLEAEIARRVLRTEPAAAAEWAERARTRIRTAGADGWLEWLASNPADERETPRSPAT